MPSDRSGPAEALVAVERERYAGMSNAERARHQAELEARCLQLRQESDPVENEYRQQLAALRDHGQFDAAAFGAIAAKRQVLLQKWVQAVAELAALPTYEDDPLVRAVLETYLGEVDDSNRLESSLVALTVGDRLPDEPAVRKAQDLLRAAEFEREPRETEAAESKQPESAKAPDGAPAECRRSNLKVKTAPACSAGQRWPAPCKRCLRCGRGAGRNR